MTRSATPVLLVLVALVSGCRAATTSPIPTPVPTVLPAQLASPTATPPASASAVPSGSAIPTPRPTPLVLDATGSTHIEMPRGALPFVARDGGRAACRSGPDSLKVADVTALELGELGSGTLRAMLGLPLETSDKASAELFIDGGDLPEGSYQPFWTGPVRITESHDDGASGTMTFHNLTLEPDPGAMKSGSTGAPADAGGWPATLSGTLSWTCQPWASPVTSSVPPPPSVGP